MNRTRPVLIETSELAADLDSDDVLIVDMSSDTAYAAAHLPGALHLDYARLTSGRPPAPGKLPATPVLNQALSSLGLTVGHHVVAYDNEGSGRAARLLWTLHALGHEGVSVLNGGFDAWVADRLPVTRDTSSVAPSAFSGQLNDAVIADRDYILARLGATDFALLDARSPDEFHGRNLRAARGGHIPGARNLNWLDTMDDSHQLRLLPADRLRAMLSERGITPDKEVVAYCQTHHRSAHAYLMLKSLGYPTVRAYPGSWSEWGNDPETPIEV